MSKKEIENNSKYSDYNDFKIEKQLNHVFIFLLILSLIMNVLVILSYKDVCTSVLYARCGFSYLLVNSDLFFIIMWIENIMSIVFALYKMLSGIIDKNCKLIILGLFCIFVQPIVWVNLLGFLNISW